MTKRFDELLRLLDLEEIELNIFRGQNESGQEGRLFGGQVLAQALAAAGRTVKDLPAHSLHAYFLRAGSPKVPVLYKVDRIRDGRSFTTRRVVAIQDGRAILNMAASFHAPEPGYDHQNSAPEAPEPESLPNWQEMIAANLDRIPDARKREARGAPPVDYRYVDLPVFMGGDARPDPNRIWVRAAGSVPDDVLLHQCILVYASDMSMIDTILRHHGMKGPLGPVAMAASLDHAVWFHRPFRADEWLLYAQESPSAAGARGFSRGSIYQRGGDLVASVAQEGLVRPTDKKG
ncbi:MAG: acyl-CoA thioesterase II [Deltaproteobacteria bacterium]|nr:acyl-CoA thioesterase II [Deltaproteobacteria bacterium]MBW2393526.1 acyl-CoA thioesterase II [Deltaproteobacteria bacterium]